jgi:hypothetical protein
MAEPDKRPVTVEELSFQALLGPTHWRRRLIEKGLIAREEFMQKIFEERATHQRSCSVELWILGPAFYSSQS